MAVYLFNYDLINETGSFAYEPLWAELLRLKAHKTQYSAWLINVNNTAKEVVDHFTLYVDKDDRLMANRLRPGEYDLRNPLPGTSEWLKKNPPV